MEKRSLVAAGQYALAAIGLHICTMLVNAHGNHNTSLPFAVCAFLVLGRFGGKNEELKHVLSVLPLMFLVSLSTLLTHYLFPVRANWYDGPMGAGVAALLLIPMQYFIGKSGARHSTDVD